MFTLCKHYFQSPGWTSLSLFTRDLWVCKCIAPWCTQEFNAISRSWSCAEQYLGNDMMTALFYFWYMLLWTDKCAPENNPDLGPCKLACHFLKSYLLQLLPLETFTKLLAASWAMQGHGYSGRRLSPKSRWLVMKGCGQLSVDVKSVLEGVAPAT